MSGGLLLLWGESAQGHMGAVVIIGPNNQHH